MRTRLGLSIDIAMMAARECGCAAPSSDLLARLALAIDWELQAAGMQSQLPLAPLVPAKRANSRVLPSPSAKALQP